MSDKYLVQIHTRSVPQLCRLLHLQEHPRSFYTVPVQSVVYANDAEELLWQKEMPERSRNMTDGLDIQEVSPYWLCKRLHYQNCLYLRVEYLEEDLHGFVFCIESLTHENNDKVKDL